MNEEQRNEQIKEDLSVSEEIISSTNETVSSNGRVDKKKIGIIAGAAAIVLVIVIALVIAFAGKGDKPSNGNNDDVDTPSDVENGTGDGTNDNEDNGYVEEKDPLRDEFVADLGGVSETFVGSVSSENYNSAKGAAEAFVNTEMVGESVATIHSVKSNGTLSASEIERLNIPAELTGDYQSIEEFEISYELGSSAAALYGKSGVVIENNGEKKVKVYVICYGDYWKYFAPMPINGNTINKSYYDSVFNEEKYKNCTMETTTVTNTLATIDGLTYNTTMEVTQTVKHADGRIYCEITMILKNEGSEPQSLTTKAYFETVDGEIKCYMYVDYIGWIPADIVTVGFKSIDELKPFYGQYLDYTYFTKTTYGFALAEENGRKYFETALHDAFEMFGDDIDVDNMDVDMMAEYYVLEGVLSGMRIDAKVNMSVTVEGVTTVVKEGITASTKCYDYGTTVIERPDVG